MLQAADRRHLPASRKIRRRKERTGVMLDSGAFAFIQE
jgi:hypothetical protein